MLKVQRTESGDVVFAVIGRLNADSLNNLSALLSLESPGRIVMLDLRDLVLVDDESVGFLWACQTKGIVLQNCPAYIRTWMKVRPSHKK